MQKKTFLNPTQIRIIVYSLAVLIIVPIVAIIDQQIIIAKNKFKTIPFGNIMSEYFYFVHTGLSDHNLVTKQLVDSFNLSDQELATFYRNLDWTAQDKLITNYHSNGDATWHSINLDGSSRTNFLAYWQTIRPHVMAFYKQYIPEVQITKPVVHFRCGDNPFIKYPQYHLTNTKSVQWMAEQIKQQGYDHIILLSCNNHRIFNQTACEQYANFYASVFSANGLSVETQCNSILQDFALMVYSPLLVSLNVSSFSFMAGVAKNPAHYISCNMGMEINGNYTLQSQADWILDPYAPLLHKDVSEYGDVPTVIAKLQS